MNKTKQEFLPLAIAVMTISDTRTEQTDTSGHWLVTHLQEAGHQLIDQCIVPDNIYKIREVISAWVARQEVQLILTNGGTGMTGRDGTPEAILPLLDKEIVGFGELFRWLSYTEIGTSTIQSRAFAGVANGTYLFCLPGSTNACALAWEKILKAQFDLRHLPCNFAELVPRLVEK